MHREACLRIAELEATNAPNLNTLRDQHVAICKAFLQSLESWGDLALVTISVSLTTLTSDLARVLDPKEQYFLCSDPLCAFACKFSREA